MKKLYTVAIVVLLMSSVAAQADAYYLYNIYPSSGHRNDYYPDKIKQKIKIKIKGDDNVVSASQHAYQYPFYSYSYPYLYPQPTPAPTPAPNPTSYYYNYSYNYNPQPQPIPQPIPYYYNYYYYNPQPQPVSVIQPNPCYNNQIYFTSQSPSADAREGQFYTHAVQATSYNCSVTYRLISAPVGMIINQSGVISWTPNYNQGGQAYSITVAASNSYSEATQTFYVYVEDGNINYPPVLKITNAAIQTTANGDVLVSWETNKSATSRVIFDVVSEANKTKEFTYTFATPDNTDLVTSHQVNLGQLEPNKTFYLRAVSKKDSEMAISNELTFVKLPVAGASAADTAGDLFSGMDLLFWLMLLIIIILAGALARSYRKPVALSRLQ